jgi:GNAT superfamily N-acetyltransferase
VEWTRGDYEISTEPARLDVEAIHRYLSDESYWARGIPRDAVERSIAGSIAFGLYRAGELAGFARVVTDRATFAYLGDVFVLPAHRGQGLGVWLVETVLSHPDLQGLRGFMLATEDAHALYERFGFRTLPKPERWMGRPMPPEQLYRGE